MRAVRKRKLYLLVAIVTSLALAAALVLYALRQNISLFYSPSEIIAGKAPLNHPIRVGGMVIKEGFERKSDSLAIVFQISDYKKQITIHYKGILPDLFRIGQGVVAEGQLIDSQTFIAKTILAKHDANYMPPEVKAALNKKELP